jgi:hypothetical protein
MTRPNAPRGAPHAHSPGRPRAVTHPLRHQRERRPTILATSSAPRSFHEVKRTIRQRRPAATYSRAVIAPAATTQAQSGGLPGTGRHSPDADGTPRQFKFRTMILVTCMSDGHPSRPTEPPRKPRAAYCPAPRPATAPDTRSQTPSRQTPPPAPAAPFAEQWRRPPAPHRRRHTRTAPAPPAAATQGSMTTAHPRSVPPRHDQPRTRRPTMDKRPHDPSPRYAYGVFPSPFQSRLKSRFQSQSGS